jgi:disulfide oxidoreductase YuzD
MKGAEMTKTEINKEVREIQWLPKIEDHNYPAAESYLLLIYEPEKVNKLSKKLKKHPIVQFKAKDIFRASDLSLLGVSNSHVQKDRKKILAGKALSPLLLIRDDRNAKVIVADGYHRLCAIYTFDEDAVVHCKIV